MLTWTGAADLAVGIVWLGAAVVTRRHSRPVTVFATAVWLTWFVAEVLPAALFWHRAPLVLLLVATPAWLPRRPMERAVVLLFCGAAVVPAAGAWPGAVAAAWLALAALVATARRGSAGRTRRVRSTAAGCLLALAAHQALVALLQTMPARYSGLVVVLVYDVVVSAIAVAVTAAVAHTPVATAADLVIDLDRHTSPSLAQSLGRVLGDPGLQVAFLRPGDSRHTDAEGRAVTPPDSSSDKATTLIDKDGESLAVIVHDRAVLDDDELGAAVSLAARLSARNAALHADARVMITELEASRRRLVTTAEAERARLRGRVESGPSRRLADVIDRLDRLHRLRLGEHPTGHELGRSPDVGGRPHLARAREHLRLVLAELDALAAGLQPIGLRDGLQPALTALCAGGSVAVQLSVVGARFPADVEAGAYFVVAEALANVAKHSGARQARVSVRDAGGAVEVEVVDEGAGGAEPGAGSGLVGMTDRVRALGGSLVIESSAGRGTCLLARIPTGEPPR